MKELCEYTDFNFCHIQLKMLSMEKGLKLKKEKQKATENSQVWTQYNPPKFNMDSFSSQKSLDIVF